MDSSRLNRLNGGSRLAEARPEALVLSQLRNVLTVLQGEQGEDGEKEGGGSVAGWIPVLSSQFGKTCISCY